MSRPVHFEIHASDPATTQSFYENVFGWRFTKWGDQDYWLVTTGDGDPMGGTPHSEPGIDGGMLPRQGPAPEDGAPVNGFVVTVTVEDTDATVAKALEHGGSIALAATDMPGVGRLAYVKDPDGTIVGVLRGEPSE